MGRKSESLLPDTVKVRKKESGRVRRFGGQKSLSEMPFCVEGVGWGASIGSAVKQTGEEQR